MEPTTAYLLASFTVGVISKLLSGNAQRDAMRRQAVSEEHQAAIAMQDAQYEAWRARMASQAQVGAAKVALSASGVDTSTGTPATTLAQVSAVGALNAQLAEVKGNRVAWTHQERARLLRAGVEDLSAANLLDIGALAINTYARYSAIGSPADKVGVSRQAQIDMQDGWDPAAEFN